MKISKMMTTCFSIATLMVTSASAQESQTSSMRAPVDSSRDVNNPTGWFPFLGLSGGYLSPDDSLRTEGTHGDLKLMGSFYSNSGRSVLDLGAGLLADSFTQKSTTQNNFLAAGVTEAAWRYNFTNRWQAGVVADTFIGGGERFGSSDPTFTTFGGIQIVKEFAVKNTNIFRIGLKGLIDASIPTTDVTAVMLDLQWGFGADQRSPEVAAYERAPSTISENAAPLEDSQDDTAWSDDSGVTGSTAGMNSRRVIEEDESINGVVLRNDERMQFPVNNADLSDEAFVQKIGQVLNQHDDLFAKVEVVGFADQTGSYQTNMNISKERAYSVVDELRQGGLASSKIQTTWKGATEPLYKSLLPEDLQQNRRVDLLFHGVKDPQALTEILKTL